MLRRYLRRGKSDTLRPASTEQLMLRQFLHRLFPSDPLTPSLLRALVSRGHRRLYRLQKLARRAASDTVVAGPFAGMRYTSRAIGSVLVAKLLGTYEMELTHLVERIITADYTAVIDVGAAEGYYAVGLAKRMPAAHVIAFEAKTADHPVLLAMAEANGVRQRIELHGFCTPEALNRSMPADRRTVVIFDIEGFEDELLDPRAVPALQHADVLVELHDFVRPEVSQRIRDRFSPTHQILKIQSRPRVLADWPGLSGFDDEQKLRAMHEGRPGVMEWFWMTARQTTTAHSDDTLSPE